VESNGFDSLNIDNEEGAAAMTKHLLSHGHTRIAIIKGTEGNVDAAERLRGYCNAMQGAGVPPDGRLQVAGDFTEASGYEAVGALLAVSPPPTAIFASNDSMAIGALSALRDRGIQIPEQMALAGFDDVPVGSYLSPALTSVHVGINNLGIKAIETVLHAVRNKNAHHKQQIILSTSLKIRESCGCTGEH
jgi:LacI family transcriptional regulator